MKAFTDILQSKKLAEFLPLESADMYYEERCNLPKAIVGSYSLHIQCRATDKDYKKLTYPVLSPCWSLAALINVISKHSSRLEIILRVDKKYNIFANFDNFIVFRKFVDIDNAIDVCVDIIETLHEQKLL